MTKTPLSTASRLLPFRTASASSGRPNLLDRLMMSRPAVANLMPTTTGRVEEADAVLSGMTRSLHSRLSGLNLPMAIRPDTTQRRVA